MSDIFISYARSTAKQAQAIAAALRSLGYLVWLDYELPAHRAYTDVIEERLRTAKAVVVAWSADAAKSLWVRAEANTALEAETLVQLSLDGVMPPLPFNQIQCADMTDWTGDLDAPGWRKVVASIADLIGEAATSPVRAPTAAELPLPAKPSIAVLPFANLSGDPEQDYFADGMVVEITAALSRIASIFVIASGSSLSFKGKGVGPREAGRQLGVRYVLEGSVRKAASRVRISVQLIDASDGAQIWTNRFEDTLDDVFALQDSVALSVAGKIEPTMQQAEIRRASARPTDNMGSYDLYLRALPLMRTYSKAGVLSALDLVNRAIALDPDYGSALSLAAVCHGQIITFGWADDLESYRRQGVALAHRALKAGEDDANVLAWGALVIASLELDQDTAIALVDKAIALNPGQSIAWNVSGVVRLKSGDTDVAIEHLETSMRLDPMGPERASQMIGMALGRFQQHRFSEAIALSKEFLQQTDNPAGYAVIAASYGHLGQTDAALEALTRYRTFSAQPIDVLVRSVIVDPNSLDLFLRGIALAEEKAPSDTPPGG